MKTEINTSPDKRILLVSDAHLPLDGRKGAARLIKKFRALIQNYRDTVQSIVLLGDIFDFWYEWKHVVPKRSTGLLFDLYEIVREGIKVHYFAGNHDFAITGYLENEIGLTVHLDEWITSIDGKKVYFHHGDGFDANDHSYRAMKRVFRSKISQSLFRSLIHPDLAMGIGKRASDVGASRREALLKTDYSAPEYHDGARKILARGYDMVVIGHTHLAETIEFEEGIYHNPGPFLSKSNYSIIEGGSPIIRTWK